MKLPQVAVTLYTLRDFCKTSADFAVTLKKVRTIGFQAIQISGVGPIPPEEIRSVADGEGLTICATHEPAVKIMREPDRVVERLAALGCKYTAYPCPNEIDFAKAGDIERLAAILDASGAVLKKAGMTLTYHNHAFEFSHYQGKPILESIYGLTNPEYLQGEIDTYWVQVGGGNPVAWCARLKNRLPLLHIKDYAIDLTSKPYYTEIGSGNLDFPAIIATAEASGCEWFIVEQDSCPGDPFDSIRKSFDYIQRNLVC